MWLLQPLPMFQSWGFWKNAFAPHELRLLNGLGEQLKIEQATVGDNQLDKEIRESEVAWVPETEEYRWLYERLSDISNRLNEMYFHLDLKAIQPLQFTEYDGSKQGFYGQHIDASYVPGVGLFRKLSFTVQLSKPEDYENGELVLYPESFDKPIKVEKELGLITVFRSHIIHEVKTVTKGIRKSLVGWIEGPLLK